MSKNNLQNTSKKNKIKFGVIEQVKILNAPTFIQINELNAKTIEKD